MEPLLHFAGNFWWLIFPLAGVVGGTVRAVAAANERRADRRLERYRIKQQTKVAVAQATGRARDDDAATQRDLERAVAQHERTESRWLSYEMDIAKLLDFPMMTDMRESLTVAFHTARSRADLVRPVGVSAGRDAVLEYRDAVHDLVAAFDVAEAEAMRRRRSDFSAEGQERIERAQRLLRLASNDAAPIGERQNAYEKARRELEGLIVLPMVARAAIERRIAGELEA